MKPRHFVCIIAVAFLSASLLTARPLPAQTESDATAELRQRNAELEQRLKDVEEKLEQCLEAGKKPFSAEQGWQNRRNWRSLEMGMNPEQVQVLLGEPVREIKGVRTFWYYPSLYGGYVSFDDKGLLSGWKEP